MRRTALVSSLTVLALAITVARSTDPSARAVTAFPRIAAVGDIACKNPPAMNRSVCQYDDVARAIGEGHYDKVLLLGDIQYENGIYEDFVENFDVYFRDLLPTTAPAPGNHEYGDAGAAGYFRYFGPLAPASFYSFELGDWHIVSLDSTICGAGGLGCLAGSPQYDWLAEDLERSDALCTLAFWHHPRWDWLKYQNADWANEYELLRSKPLWDLLYAHDADLVLNGHNHNYSRWKPADADGHLDPARGLTQFVVGTGGRNLNGFGNFHTRPEIFARGQSKAFGFLDLRLRPAGWDYRWISADGQPAFTDRGSGSCH